MSRFVPWALVALCFALGVASRSISDSFVVFVPALQSAFDASRSAITVVYSFALLVGVEGALQRRHEDDEGIADRTAGHAEREA